MPEKKTKVAVLVITTFILGSIPKKFHHPTGDRV
jgi:hypothetical protein